MATTMATTINITEVTEVTEARARLAALEEQGQAAAREQAALEGEQESLPGKISIAAQAADASELLRLRQRQAELPAHVFAATVKIWRLRIAHAEARLPILLNEERAAKEESDRREVIYAQALQAWQEAGEWRLGAASAINATSQRTLDLRRGITQMQADLKQLIAQQGS